jgi:hypothetical protein
VQRIARSCWFNNSCIIWGIFTVITLLLVQLGVHMPGAREHSPLWRQLNDINSLLFAVGFVAFAATMWLVHRRLDKWIPRSAQRSASLRPRCAADSVSLPWRIATEGLTVALFATWIVFGILGIARSPKLWSGLAFLMVISAILAVLARVSARRRPNYMDRLYGPAYRHREVRIIYGMRLAFIAFGIVALTGSVVRPAALPVDPARMALLLFQILFFSCLLAFVLIKPAGTPRAPARPVVESRGLALSLIMLVAVPIIAVAATSTISPARCCAASTPSFHAPQAAASEDRPWAGRWLR